MFRSSYHAVAFLLSVGLLVVLVHPGLAYNQEVIETTESRVVSRTTPDLQALEVELEESPDRHDLRYKLARGLERNQLFEQAAKHYRILTERAPEDADHWYGLSRVLHFRGQSEEALRVIRSGQDRAPQYRDLFEWELRILRDQGKRQLYESRRNELLDQFSDLDSPRWTAGAASVRAELESSLWNVSGRSDWQAHTARLRYRRSKTVLTGTLSRLRRFDTNGTWVGLRADRSLSDHLGGYLEVGGGDADYLADMELGGGLEWWLRDTVALETSLRYRTYGSQQTYTVAPGIIGVFDRGSIGYRWYVSYLEAGASAVALTRYLYGRFRLTPEWTLRAGAASGQAVEAVTPDRVEKTTIWSVNAGLEYGGLGPGLLRFGFEYEDLDDFYQRSGMTVGYQVDI